MKDDALLRARIVVASLVAGPVVLAAVLLALGADARPTRLAVPAALAGLVALPVAWRLHAWMLDRARAGSSPALRGAGFYRAIVLALAVTEGAALLGLIAYRVSGELICLVGLAMHVLAAGVLWPSRDRFDDFVGAAGPDRP